MSEVTTFTSPAVVRGDESVTDRGDPSLMGRGDASDTVRVEDRGVGKEVNGLLNEEIGGLRVGRELGGLREESTSFPASVRVRDCEILSSSSGSMRIPWASSSLDRYEH